MCLNFDLRLDKTLERLGIMWGHCAIQRTGPVFIGLAPFLQDLFAGKPFDIKKAEMDDIAEDDMRNALKKVNHILVRCSIHPPLIHLVGKWKCSGFDSQRKVAHKRNHFELRFVCWHPQSI